MAGVIGALCKFEESFFSIGPYHVPSEPYLFCPNKYHTERDGLDQVTP